MRISSNSPPPARGVLVSSHNGDTAPSAAAPKVTTKKSQARKVAAEAPEAGSSLATKSEGPSLAKAAQASTPTNPVELTEMIATAAYFIAAERNFAPGNELDDWLAAERQVRRLYPQ